MKNIVKRLLSVGLALMLLFTCAFALAEGDYIGEITIMTTYWAPFDPENNLVKYAEEATGIKVNIDYNLSSDYATKVGTVLMSGELPDVIIGIILFFIIGSEFFINYQILFRKKRHITDKGGNIK